MLRRLLCVLCLCFAVFSVADIAALYKKPSNIAASDTYQRVIPGPNLSSYVLALNQETDEYTVRKFDSTGAVLWTSTKFPTASYDEADIYDMAADDDGNVYLAGRRLPTGDDQYQAVAYKIRSTNGALVWTRVHPTSALGSTQFTHILVQDSKVTAVLSGQLFSGQVNQLIQWDLLGIQQGYTGGSTGPAVNDPEAIAVHNGEFYVTGFTTGSPNLRGFLRRYNAALELVATVYYQVSSVYSSKLHGIAIADTGEICLFGEGQSSSNYYGVMLAFDSDFNLLVEDLTEVPTDLGNGRIMYRGYVDRVSGQLRMTGFGGNGSWEVGVDRLIARQVAVPSGQVRWQVNNNTLKAPGIVRRDSHGDFWFGGYLFDGDIRNTVMRLNRDSGVIEDSFSTPQGSGFDTMFGFCLDAYDEPRIVGYREVSNNVTDGVYWHLVQTPAPVNDTVYAQNNVMTALDVFANDSYVHPGCTITITDAPDHGTAVVNGSKTAINYTPTNGYLGPDTFVYRVVRGTFSASATVTINVRGFLLSVSADRNPIAGQNQTFGRLTLSGAAPAGGAVVTVSDNSSLITTPPSATIAAGATVGTFVIKVDPVTSQQVRTISATYLGVTRTVDLTLNPLVPTAISFTPNPLVGGGTASCKVVINGVAGAGGRTIAIVETSAYCAAPTTVTVPAGAGSVTFNIPTSHPATQQVVTVIARVTAGEVSAILRINP